MASTQGKDGGAARAGGGEAAGPAVRLHRVSRVFKDFWGRRKHRALREASIEVRRGEIYGLLGPNGSGKTTALKIIMGLLRPTGGEVAVLGHRPGDRRALARIGYLPEDPAHYGFLDARESLEFYGRLFGLDRGARRRRADDLIRQLAMGEYAGRPAREYSKGMGQRLGIAQALVNEPDLLVLDEPTSGLDPVAHRMVKDLLLGLRDRGTTILISSHLLSDVEDVCDRIGVLGGGKVLLEGSVKELLAEEGALQVKVRGLGEAAIRQALRSAGGDVEGLETPHGSLDDLFLKAIGGGGDGPGAAGKPEPGEG